MKEKFNPEGHEVAPVEKRESGLYLEEMETVEYAMAEMVMQLKDSIDASEFDMLISDEAGGRVPTLILRKIIKLVHPDKPSITTRFIAAGDALTRADEQQLVKLQEVLQKVSKETEGPLVVTQYWNGGRASSLFLKQLKKAGIHNIGFAALAANEYNLQGTESDFFETTNDVHSFLPKNLSWTPLNDEHEHLGGVRSPGKFSTDTPREYSPYPMRYLDTIEIDGRDLSFDEKREVYGIGERDTWPSMKEKFDDPEKRANYEKVIREPATPEEVATHKDKVMKARTDIDTIAHRIYKTLWLQEDVDKTA